MSTAQMFHYICTLMLWSRNLTLEQSSSYRNWLCVTAVLLWWSVHWTATNASGVNGGMEGGGCQVDGSEVKP